MRTVRRRDPSGRRVVRRAVVMVPNGFTLFNLLCGIYAIVLSIRGDVGSAPAWIVAGGIADAFDGRVARATGTGSRFGAELDSLVDAISFGLAPALIVFQGQPVGTQGSLDWLLVFIYCACAVMRLARFNVEQAGRAKTHFHGLPSPAAGLTLATYYWFSQTPLYRETVILFTDGTTLAQLPWHNLLRGLMAILAALMISDVPYPAMPSIGLNSIKKVLGTLMVVGSIALLVFVRKEFLFPALVAYVLYGVIKWMILGFVGRTSTPDEIFWQREAELHQEDESHSEYERPHIAQEVLEDLATDEEEETSRPSRDARPARESREPRDSRERERPARKGRDREERKAKRRDEPRRDEPPREKPPRDEPPREKPPRDEPPREKPPREKPRRDEPRRDEPRRDEPRREETRPPRETEAEALPSEQQPPPRNEQPRPDVPRRADDRHAETIAIENEPELLQADNELGGDDDADGERREPERKPDDETQVRKRRRRRGRGGRGRGERAAQAAGGGDDSDADTAGDDAAGSSNGGDTPPRPSLPETPDPSGNTE